MSKAWYNYYREYIIEATSLMQGFIERLNEDNSLYAFFKEFERENFTKFIFESNSMEKEGLSEGKTRKLIIENFDLQIRQALENVLYNVDYEVIIDDTKLTLIDFENIDSEADFEELVQLLAVKYKNKKKDISSVIAGVVALLTAEIMKNSYLIENLKFLQKNNAKDVNCLAFGNIDSLYIRNYKNVLDNGKYLINEKNIKTLHKIIAKNSSNNENGKPGKYRPESACINPDTVFISPYLIPNAMKSLINGHKERFKNASYNPIVEACKLSGDFVLIHPFGDFNGRISRILLNMILRFEGLPFYLILRSKAKDRNRYMTSMSHYAQGKPNSYLALVSKIFIEEIEVINSQLIYAKLDPIKPAKLSKYQFELIEDALIKYNENVLKISR